jgi:hypothetical protein
MWSGCSAVLIDHSVEDLVASDRGVEGDRGRWVVVRRVLVEALVGAVIGEVADILVEDAARIRRLVPAPR